MSTSSAPIPAAPDAALAELGPEERVRLARALARALRDERDRERRWAAKRRLE